MRTPAAFQIRPRAAFAALALAFLLSAGVAVRSTSVPTDIQQPGTQPTEVTLVPQTHADCAQCHTGTPAAPVEIGTKYDGSMMAHAGRDPLMWAALAVAEQDFPGSGDLCLRCHVPRGWLEGRSEPTDGSALLESDADGVACLLCHLLTDPEVTTGPLSGVQNGDFVAIGGMPAAGFHGSGMYVLSGGQERLGPYDDADSPHMSRQSLFHRSSDLCGTCHDVSNPAVGDLAHNNGAQVPLAPGTFSGIPGAPVDEKAAFNNPPYAYGVVERTYSEHVASLLSQTEVKDFPFLPQDLQGGALAEAYQRAVAVDPDPDPDLIGDYLDGTPRLFTCQTCHMQPAFDANGCNQTSNRNDLPTHDLVGANYWAPDAIRYLDQIGGLRLGSNLTPEQDTALEAGKGRALHNLTQAATLSVNGDVLRVINHTGHKLITGYPEGRRMWLNIKWYDRKGFFLREDGEYGTLSVTIDGNQVDVETILDLDDPNLRLYATHHGMTSEWASQLLGMGYPLDLPLTFDHVSGAVVDTLESLASQPPGTLLETFHFVLNNVVKEDTRIPPYGMSYDEARVRNALPVPAHQYGNPGPGGAYDYFDSFQLSPPPEAAQATIELLYQPTSWEYVQFLYLANDQTNPFLALEGFHALGAWLHATSQQGAETRMARPVVMASTTWSSPSLFLEYCSGDGSATPCPCGNDGAPGHGCDNIQATGGALLTATGIPVNNGVMLQGSSLPQTTTVLAIRSQVQANGGAGVVFGDGLLCLAAPVTRLTGRISHAGLVSIPLNHGAGPGNFHYQLWYRNLGPFCTPDKFNLSNGLSAFWP